MGDRNTLLQFLETRYTEADLARLWQIFELRPPMPSNATPHAGWESLLQSLERDGMASALLAQVEKDFPGELPPLEWAGARSYSMGTNGVSNLPHLSLVTANDLSLEADEDMQPLAGDEATIPDFAQAVADFETLRRDFVADSRQTAEPPSVRFVHGYTLPEHWARRDIEMAELIEALRSNHHRIISLVAIGGTGKSALTRKLLEEVSDQGIKLDGALWFSFYVEPEFDRFLVEACRLLVPGFDPKLHPSMFEKAVMLREALERGRYLLVMDGIEVLLVSDRERRDFGSFQDRAIRDFLNEVLAGSRSQVIISSRFPLIDLADKPAHLTIELGDLEQTAADELLASYGVTGDDAARAPVYARFGTHALTMQLLGDYLTRYHTGDPKAITEIPVFPEDAGQGLKIQAALDAYWQRLQPDERFFLARMSAFRGGVDERSLIVLNRSGDAFDPHFRTMVENLLRSPLVTVERRGRRARLTAHPLIKTFFYERMADPERDQTHRALKDYAQGLPLPDRPHTMEDYAPLLDACYHCLRVGLYREAYQIYRRNNMDNALRWWGHYSEAMALLEPLRQAGLGEAPSWQSERWQRSWVENETALLATLQGNSELAIERFRRSAEIDMESGDGPGESASWQNLAGVLTQRGDYQAALEALEKSRAIETRLRRYEKEDMLAGLEGVCRAEMGQSQRAFDLLCQALELSTQHINPRAICYWTWRIGDLYLGAGQIAESRQQHAEALRVAQKEQFRDYECYALRGLGDGYRFEGNLEKAAQTYGDALRLARTLGNPYLENEVRLGLARLGEQERNYQEAQGQSRQALARAEECGYRAHAAQAHLLLGRSARVANDVESLHSHARQVRTLLQQTPHAITTQEFTLLLREVPDLLS